MKSNKLVTNIIYIVVGLSLLNGCSNKPKSIRNSDGTTNRLETVATGTIVGAGIGAVVGKQFNDTKFGALVGGMIGSVVGDVVHKTNKAAASNEHVYAKKEQKNNETRDKLNKKSDEMENTMGSLNK